MSEFRTAGLFSGIGGLELGLERAGCETHLLCEVDPVAQSVLAARFPNVPIQSDIRNLSKLPAAINFVSAGFPCQDLSSIGSKAGLSGARSGLVSEMLRLVAPAHVEWVLVENVPFMLQLQKGYAMTALVDSLESLGFAWAYRVLDSQDFGLPQRRRRVYLLASRVADPAPLLMGMLPHQTHQPHEGSVYASAASSWGFYWTEGTYATGLAEGAIPPLKAGSTIGIPSPPAILLPDGRVVTPDIADAERLQGFPAHWTKPAEAAYRASLRWRLVGNAVTIPVPEWVGARIRAHNEPPAVMDRTPLSGTHWPPAAFGSAGRRYAGVATSAHTSPRQDIGLFLQHPPKLLSARATRGFLGRAAKGNLQYPDGFITALEKHAEAMKGDGLDKTA